MYFLRNRKFEMIKALISINEALIHNEDKNGRNIMHYLMMPEEKELSNNDMALKHSTQP